MPKKNALIMEVILAFAAGCGGAAVDHDACEWFFERYYPWIDKPSKNPKAGGKSPQEVWGTEGPGFLGKFKEIGKRAASGGGTINSATLSTAALKVEQESDCPYCP
jgi:hypothetical protein